jgi:hypothetical protein
MNRTPPVAGQPLDGGRGANVTLPGRAGFGRAPDRPSALKRTAVSAKPRAIKLSQWIGDCGAYLASDSCSDQPTSREPVTRSSKLPFTPRDPSAHSSKAPPRVRARANQCQTRATSYESSRARGLALTAVRFSIEGVSGTRPNPDRPSLCL